MATDPLADLFGPQAANPDPLADVFGPPIEDFQKGNEPFRTGTSAPELVERQLTDPEFAKRTARTPAPPPEPERQEDSWLTVGRKALENAPELMLELPAGGFMQQAGNIAAETLGAVATPLGGFSFGRLIDDAVQPFLERANEPIAEVGEQIAADARAELERNAPQTDSFAKQLAYDSITGIMQFGSAMAAAGLTRSPTVGATVVGVQVVGEQIDDSLRKGRTPDQALADGVFMGAAEIISERIPLGILLDRAGGGILKRIGKGVAAEGIQEALTEAIQTGYGVGVLNEEMTWGEAVKQIGYAGLVGGIVGGTVAAGSHPFVRERKQRFQEGVDLGLEPETAADFARATVPRPEEAEAMREAGFNPELTPEDHASPIPDVILEMGKKTLGEGLAGTTPTRTPSAPASSSAREALKQRIRGAESSGNDQAKNPRSTASGRYQFIDSTWAALGGDPAKRNDPAEQERLMDKLLDQNEAALREDGRQITPGNLYLAHFLGAQGAIDALANPNAPVDAKVVASNPFAEGWTNGELAAWANRKMGGKPGEWTSNPNTAADRAWAEKDADADGSELVQVDSVRDTLKRTLGEDILDFSAEQRIEVDQGSGPVRGTVEEVYGEGDELGIRAKLDDGTMFDEVVGRAREYGAKIRTPAATKFRGEKIDGDWHRFAPETGTLNIPRAEMPQIKGEHRGALVNFLEARGIKHSEPRRVDADTLKPSQAEFSDKKAASWDRGNVKLEDRAVLTSSDGYLLDGHHQWVKALETGQQVSEIRLDAPIAELLPAVKEFPSARTSEGAVKTEGQAAPEAAEQTRPETRDAARARLEAKGFFFDKSGRKFELKEKDGGFTTRFDKQEGGKDERSFKTRESAVNWLTSRATLEKAADGPIFDKDGKPDHEARHRAAKVSQAREDAKNLGPAKPSTREEAEIALEGGRKVKAGNKTYQLEETPKGWTVVSAWDDSPNIKSQLGGGIEEWSKSFAINRAMEEIEPRLPKPRGTAPEQEAPAPTEVSDGRFKATWTSKSFKAAMKPLGDMPHRESPAAAELVRGWLDGRAGNLDALRAEVGKALQVAAGVQGDGSDVWNPRQSYLEGYYAAEFEDAAKEVRAKGGFRDVLSPEQVLAAVTREPEPVAAAGPRVAVNYVGPDGQTDAERGRELTKLERDAHNLRNEADPFQRELAEWAEGTPFRFENPGVKGVDRIVEKVETEHYSSPRALKDIVRGALVVESQAEADQALAAVAARFPGTENDDGRPAAGAHFDKGEKAVVSGYFDRKVIVGFPNGVMGEIQIVHRQMFDETKRVRKDGVYDEWRSIPGFDQEGAPPRARELEAQMYERYANAASGTSFAKAYSDSMAALAARNSFAKSVWERLEPTFLTSPGAAPQEPSSNTNANPLPPDTPLATGLPSISKNVSPSIDTNVGNAAGVGNVSATEGIVGDPAEAGRAAARAGEPRFLNFNASHPRSRERAAAWYAAYDSEQRKIADEKSVRKAQEAEGYGAANKYFTRDKAEAARELIRSKLNQLNAGFDPELAAAGMNIAGFHIEAGARKFADLAKAVADHLGVELSKLKPYLRAWYNSARDTLEDAGEDVSDMDGPGAVRAAVAMIPDEPSLSTGVDGIGDNGGTNAGTSTDQGAQELDRAGDAREGAVDAQGIEGVGEPGQSADGAGEAGTGQLRDGDNAGERLGAVDESEPAVSGDSERARAGAERGGTDSARSSRRVRDGSRGSNFRAAAGSLARKGGWKAAAERNLDIIELVNTLDAEGRPATADEQALLAKWVGWGASEIRNNLFRYVDRKTMTINEPLYGGEWADTIKRARELVKGPALEAALQSVQYAHYTSEGVVRGIWDAMQRMGFGGGRILEPGMGIGHFFTAAPDSVAEHSTYTGIEFESFTARIAKYLLPQENVIEGDYTKQAFPDGFFDAAIGNPPFSSTKVLNDPAYKRMRLSLHNYFFVKSLDKVRPGGLVAFITSRYTMDALDPKQRQFMADRADLVGAIRLPQTAFKENAGTEVVTDVLFFQKRMPGAEPAGQSWLGTEQVTVDGSKFAVNEYWKKNPQMVLGKFARGKMYTREDITVEPYASKGSIEKQFAEAVSALPENIYTAAPERAKESIQAKAFERDFAPASSKEGGLYVKDGKVLVVDRGSGVSVDALGTKLSAKDHAWLKGYVKLRDKLKDAQRAQLEDAADWETHLDALRKEYRAFTKKHGRINEFTTYDRKTKDDDGEEVVTTYRRYKWNRLLFDIEAPMVQSLEKITDAGEIEDGPFLLGRTLNKPVRPAIETVDDALAVTLDEIGKLDLGYIAKLVDRTQDEVVAELGDRIYQTPAGEWQTADEYLSGNVLEKLEQAQQAAATAPEYQRNVEALLKVQPAPLSFDKITVKLGAPWLKPETIRQFADEVLGEGTTITYEPATAHWNVEGAKSRYRRSNTDDYGTSDRSALELLDALLNNRTIKVTRTETIDGSKRTYTDENATTAANEAAKKITERFKTWLWEDGARTGEYVDIYNRAYNNIAPRRFSGDHLTLPGLSVNFKPHPHVKRAVWRQIQTGNTYLAHAVGAGKTAEQIIGGQEQRRLGLIKKPMHVVPNHMLNQFAQEFLQLYPAANIMVADEQAFHTGNRRRFLAQAALNDPDAIIITHSAFGKIDTSPDMREAIVNRMIDELESAMKDAKDGDSPRHLVSRIEKQIEQLKRRFEGKTGTGKDKLLTFDELGVDFLYIDEAHEFRKLDFATNRQAKGIDSNGSQKALDLFIKSQWLEEQNPGRSMVLASGTPVTNTMAELYTVMRYLDLKNLEKDGIAAFDAWANMFGEIAPGYERNAAGGYEIVERFAKFVNVPELMKRVRNFMDVLLSAELGDLVKRPKIKGGGPQNIIAPVSDALDAYMKGELETRLKKSREWKPSKEQPGNPDPVLNIITDARLASIDMRFVSTGRKSDPNTKLNQMIAKIAEIHHATKGNVYLNKDGTKQPRKGSAQIVFSPVGFGEQVAKRRNFSAREWMDSELVRLGVKKSEIGWMSDANTHAKKEQLQKDVRSGKVRIVVGSPKNMGTGLNVQDRLIALHMLAPPWYPSDVTQPHGRIERQGNQNEEIEMFWYATEGTYDSTGWGMVARKQKFIDDAMSGDESVRVIEDISEINMFEMAAALAAGDERVIKIAALGGEVERLKRLKGAHATAQRELRSNINTLETFEIPRLEEERAELKAANDARGQRYREFGMKVGNKSFDKHGEAGEALKAEAQKVIDNNITVPRTEIGRLYGEFPVFLAPSERGADLRFELEVGGTALTVGNRFDLGGLEEMDNVGLSRRFETAIQRIPSDLQGVEHMLAEANKKLELSKRKFGAPFPEEGQLSEAIAEQARLQQEMTAETEAKNKAAEEPQPATSDLTVDGAEFIRGLTPEQVQEGREYLEGLMQRLLPGDRVALNVARRILGGPAGEAAGRFHHNERLIEVALAASNDITWTLGHEGVHAMRSLGLFTPAEWSLLVKDSWEDSPKRQQRVREQWAPYNLTEAQLQEEAVAENFGEFVGLFHHPEAAKSRWKSMVLRSLRRMFQFLNALVGTVRKLMGKPTTVTESNKLLMRMETGEIGARPTGFGTRPTVPREGEVSFSPADEARWSDERINRLLQKYAVDHNPTRTKSYVAWVTPQQFLDVTTPADMQGELREETRPLDREQLARETQELFLLVEESEGDSVLEVTGHEGRHRMAALSAAGVQRVPVVVSRRDIGWRDLEDAGTTVLLRERHTRDISGAKNIILDRMVPLTYANEQRIRDEFGGPAAVSFEAIAPPAPASPDFGGDSERRWQEAKKGIGSGPSVVEKASAWWQDLTGGFTRHWRDLPNIPRFAEVFQKLRFLEAAPENAMVNAVRHLRAIVGDMTAAEYDLFSRKVVLDDLAWDAGEGRELPFGFTPSSLADARRNVDAQVGLSPKLIKALRARKAHNDRIANEMVRAGVLTREQIKNPAYFRHMVLDYARHEAMLARSPSKVKSPYWAKRMGSSLDINANLLEAELDWLQKAQIDIATADTIEFIKNSELNQREELRQRARDDNKQAIDAILASNPAARKEDAWFRQNIGRGFQIVKEELEAGRLDPVPPHLQAQADAVVTGSRDGAPPFALMAWILDNNKSGAMGAGMILKYAGLRKQWRRKMLGDRYVDSDDVAALVKHYKPEGMVAWQPKDGRHLFTAKTISESALDMFVTKLGDTATPGLDRAELQAALGSVRSQLVVGGDRYTMVLPEELAATLDEFGDRRGEGMVASVFSGIQSAWKRWVLINPRRWFKYNLNNQTGDLDALIAGKPGALRRVGEAWTMLREASKGNPSARYTEALERGVFTSGLSAQEIPDINAFSEFRHLTEAKRNRPDKLMVRAIGKVWRVLQDTTNFREALFRLAAYLEYVDAIESGKPQLEIGYGASIPNIVDAVKDPKDRAALLARDIIGDYGAISVAGSWLRRYAIPFWSWYEINLRRYWRLTGNAWTTSKARGLATGGLLGASVAVRTGISLYVRIGLFYALANLWNALLFPDEEDDLSEFQKAQLHLILGRDSAGEVVTIRAQGAFSDVLHALGFSDAMLAFNKWRNDQGSLGSVVTDMGKGAANRLLTSWTPLFGIPTELAIGQKLWPDLFNPREIHDNWRHLFQTVSVENEYDALAGKPSRGYARSWTESLIYRRDPGEMAYNEAKGIAYDWKERVKGEEGGSFSSPRADALRNYRLAVRYGDEEAALKYLDAYEAAGGTDRGFKQSINRQHPLGPIAKKDRAEFLASLTDEQLVIFEEAEDYWRRLYIDGE